MLPSPGAVFQPNQVLDDYGKVLAAVSPFDPANGKRKQGILSRKKGASTAIEAIRKADEEGPGIVGFYLDLKADVTGLLDYRIQRWDRIALRWVWDDHPAASSALATDLLGPNGERIEDFARQFARELEAVGEVGFAAVNDPATGTVRYRTFPLDPGSYEVVEKNRDGSPAVIAFKGTRTSKRPGKNESRHDWIELPAANVIRVYRPHPRYFAEPYTPLVRSLDSIRRYENAGRALHRAVASQLINGGLLWFQGTSKDLMQPTPGQPAGLRGQRNLGFLGQQIKGIMDAGERSLTDYDETDVQSAMFHPIVSENQAPAFVDAGRTVDPQMMEVKRDALEDFARSVNMPMSILIEGQGAAQRMLNEWLQDRAFKQTSIMPDARRVAAGLTVAFLHPRLQRLSEREPRLFLADGQQIPVTDFRIYPDEASITQDEPEIEDVRKAVLDGVIAPQALVDALDAQGYAMQRPEGITDWDWWLLRNQRNDTDFRADDDLGEAQQTQRQASVWSRPWGA